MTFKIDGKIITATLNTHGYTDTHAHTHMGMIDR